MRSGHRNQTLSKGKASYFALFHPVKNSDYTWHGRWLQNDEMV